MELKDEILLCLNSIYNREIMSFSLKIFLGLISFFLLFSIAFSFEISNIPSTPADPLNFLSVYQNGSIVNVFDLKQLNTSLFDPGIHAVVVQKEKTIETYFINNEQILHKIDESLLNETFLEEEGYLKDEKVPVIVELNIEEQQGNDNDFQLFGMEASDNADTFITAKEEVNKILEFDESEDRIKEDLQIIDSVAADVSLDKLSKIASLDSVEKIHLDKKIEVLLNESVPLINATNAWQVLDSNSLNITGRGVSIAIIDTGIDYTHPDLGGCLGTGCKVVSGYDFVNTDNDPIDDHGHGTHVAATSAGNGTLKGVAPDATLYAYKALSSGGWGYSSWIISSIQRATDPNNDGDFSDHVDIISMSLGGSGNEDDILSKAVDTAVDRGVVVISAAGNSGTSVNAIGSPGSARKGIAVAASDKNDKIAYFSSRGPTPLNNIKPDITAPGVNICAAQWDSWLSTRQCIDNRHISISGTSMATPHVSGIAALVMQKNPTWSASMVKSALMSTAIDLGNSLWEQGTGRINASRALSPLFVTFPQTINFGQTTLDVVEEQLIIQNLNSSSITLNVTAGLMKDSTGNTYNISYITNSTTDANITTLTIGAGLNATINLTIAIGSTEGTLYGYINLTSEREVYRVPYAFTRLSKLTVNVTDKNGRALNPVFITLHNSTLAYTRYAIAWDIVNGKYTFNLPSGDYIVHALGDYNNRSLTYILTTNISVPAGKHVQANLSLNNVKDYNITAFSVNNTPLSIYKWQYMIEDRSGSKKWTASMTYLSYGLTGSRIVSLSNTTNDTTQPNISFSIVGYPFRNNTYSESAITWDEETFNSGNELYFLGYVLNGVSGSTQTIFNYTSSDLGIFNYSYNYPGHDPRLDVTYPVDGFHGIYFWISPISWFDISAWHSFAMPLNRTVFVKGDSSWGYWNYVTYNYLTKSFLGGDWRNEFAAAAGQSEDDTKVQNIWPVGVRTNAGDRRTVYFGGTPYLPTHLDSISSLINVSSYLLRGLTNESYMTKYPRVTWYSSTGETGTINLPTPVVTIYDANNNQIYNYTSGWLTFSRSLSNSLYTVNISIPTGYPISNQTIITAKFSTALSDKNPPFISSMTFPQRFEINRPIAFSFNVSDNSDVINVTAYYSTGTIGWTQLTLTNQSGIYNSTITVTNVSTDQINLLLSMNDTTANQANYTFMSIARLGHNVSLNFTADRTNVNQGDTIIFTGRITDTADNKYLKGMKIVFLLNGSEAGYDRSEISSNTWTYNTKRGWHIVNQGEFETIWEIPSNYPSGTVNFSAVFNGTGIYFSNVTNIQINVNGSAPQWFDLNITPSSPDANDNIQFNSTWTNINKVFFVSNYSGTSAEYSTSNTGTRYNHTIVGGTLNANTVITYRFRGNSSSNVFNDSMSARNLRILEVATNLTAGQTLLSVNQYQNNTLYCDYVEVGNGDVTSATVKAEIDSSNSTMTYNSSSGRYELQHNATTSGTKNWKCYANRTNYQGQVALSAFGVVGETGIPTYSNVVRTSDPIYSNNNVTVNATWSDNSALGAILLSSNFSNGNWLNYTIATNPGSSYTANFTITSGNFTSGEAIGWKYLANDTSNNWNNLMPEQTFLIQNRIPQINILSNDDNKGWGESWTFVCDATDADNDPLSVYLWSKPPNGNWTLEDSNTENSTVVNSTFTSSYLVPSYIGTAQFKCNVTDSKNGVNEIGGTNITVEKDDVNLTVVAGTNGTVERYGANSIDLIVRIYDIDKAEYVNTPETDFNITNDGSAPYDMSLPCIGNATGHCSVTLNPDVLYSVGTQYFVVSTRASNDTYKSANSTQNNFTVLGALFTSIDSPRGAFNMTEEIYLNTTVTDDTENAITADKVILEYRRGTETAEWKSCAPVNETQGAKYFCVINASHLNLTAGIYGVRYTAKKANYTESNITIDHQFVILKMIVFNTVNNFTANISHSINATQMNSTIEIISNATLNNVQLNITFNSSSFADINMSVTELRKYLRINVSDTLTRNLSYAIIKINYTDEEVNQSGVLESSLRLYRLNGTSWTAYNNQSSDFQGGVATDLNYVWGNVTRFSDFGVGGLKPNGQACESNSECDSGNCAADLDDQGKWCSPVNNCAHDYIVTYQNGNRTCSGSTKQTCGSGNWSAEFCPAGCAAGSCSSSSTQSTGSSGGGGGGAAPLKLTTTTINEKEIKESIATTTTTMLITTTTLQSPTTTTAYQIPTELSDRKFVKIFIFSTFALVILLLVVVSLKKLRRRSKEESFVKPIEKKRHYASKQRKK